MAEPLATAMAAGAPGAEADRETPVGVPYMRWAAALSIPVVLIGVFAYPDVQLAMMPMSIALVILTASAAAIVLAGRLRLLILLPLIAAFLPSLQIGFAAYLLALAYFLVEYGGQRLVRPLDGVDWALLAVLLWTVMSWLANLGGQTDLWSLPVYTITFLSPWLLLFVARAAPWTEGELKIVIGAWLALAVSQLAAVFVKPFVIGMPEAYSVPFIVFQITGVALLRDLIASDAADITTGTAQSAHHLGAALILAVVVVGGLYVLTRRSRLLWLAGILLFAFLMTDSKHLMLAALLPGVVWLAVVVWPVLARDWRLRLRAAGLVLALTAGPVLAIRVAQVVIDDLWRPYVVLATVNPKVQLFLRTGDLLARNNVNTWIGYGPGVFATRAATTRATDVLYKEANRLPGFIPAYTSPAYRSIAYDLYTSQIAETVRYRSGALTNPFSSLVGMVGEYGLAGFVVLVIFFAAVARKGYRVWRESALPPAWRSAGAAAGFAVPFLFLLGIFDSYFEQPDVTAPIVTLLLVAFAGWDRLHAGRRAPKRAG